MQFSIFQLLFLQIFLPLGVRSDLSFSFFFIFKENPFLNEKKEGWNRCYIPHKMSASYCKGHLSFLRRGLGFPWGSVLNKLEEGSFIHNKWESTLSCVGRNMPPAQKGQSLTIPRASLTLEACEDSKSPPGEQRWGAWWVQADKTVRKPELWTTVVMDLYHAHEGSGEENGKSISSCLYMPTTPLLVLIPSIKFSTYLQHSVKVHLYPHQSP